MKQGAPLFAQALALVVATAILAQLTTLAAVVMVPMTHSSFTLREVANTLRGAPPPEDRRTTLDVEVVDAPPKGWEKDDPLERRFRLTLAELLGTPLDDIRVEQQMPFPGGMWLLRYNRPTLPEDQLPTQPFARRDTAFFEDAAVAARRADGRWVVVSDPAQWGGISTFLIIWLLANALVLAALAWLFTQRLVAPIRAFADAAERAGRGEKDAVFPEQGPREVRKSARALAEMQRRVAGAVEERTRLIAAVAHDLRTPLTRLRFRAEYAPPEHRERMVGDIERMDGMIGGVLAFARGEDHLNRKRLDLAALVQSMADDLVETGAEVSVVDVAPVEVVGDPLALRRLIANLLDNAIKYGGSACCRVRREGGDALLLVDDQGPAIDEESLERVFTPFERGDAARDPATGGIGLGLALARGIARAHGGEVWLSRLPQRGLRAHVRLPAAATGGAV